MYSLDICRKRLPSGIVELKLRGNLDANTFDRFATEVGELLELGEGERLIVGMEEVSAVSSAGAGTMLLLTEQVAGRGGVLVFHSLPEQVIKNLTILGIVGARPFVEHKLTVAGNRLGAIELAESHVRATAAGEAIG